jgi:hypothetical protein
MSQFCGGGDFLGQQHSACVVCVITHLTRRCNFCSSKVRRPALFFCSFGKHALFLDNLRCCNLTNWRLFCATAGGKKSTKWCVWLRGLKPKRCNYLVWSRSHFDVLLLFSLVWRTEHTIERTRSYVSIITSLDVLCNYANKVNLYCNPRVDLTECHISFMIFKINRIPWIIENVQRLVGKLTS